MSINPALKLNKPNSGKLVKIFHGSNTEVHFGVPLYLEEDLSIQVTNTYEDPLQKLKDTIGSSGIGKAVTNVIDTVNTATAMTTGVRLTTRFSSPEAWLKTSKLKFSTKFSFAMGSNDLWSGKEEVYLPIKKLGEVCLPQLPANGILLKGPGPSYASMLQAMGRSLFSGVTGEQTSQLSENEITNNEKGTSSGIIHIEIGDGKILKTRDQMPGGVVPKDFSYTFSKEMDSNGYPISGTATIQWESFVIATAGESFGTGA